MNNKAIEKLELNKINGILEKYAITYKGKQKAKELMPFAFAHDAKKDIPIHCFHKSDKSTDQAIWIYKKSYNRNYRRYNNAI